MCGLHLLDSSLFILHSSLFPSSGVLSFILRCFVILSGVYGVEGSVNVSIHSIVKHT